MEFRIADTFTISLTRLTGEEQKLVKTTAFDLQLNPAIPGMNFHKLAHCRDKNFWSVRVNSDIRIIVHKTQTSLLLCYVDHHEQAYRWAETRKLETHPTTRAAQLVEFRQSIVDLPVATIFASETALLAKPVLFTEVSDEDMLSYGLPPEWLSTVREATEDTILDLVGHLPGEAAEALLCLATGARPQLVPPSHENQDPFDHPDAQRRFRVMRNVEELERALDYPWEKWTVFLHPSQRQSVERDYNGPARVSGSAGTGKTIVALHRAVHLARTNRDARILLVTFSEILSNALRTKLKRLVFNEPRLGERLEVLSINSVGKRLYELLVSRPTIISREKLLHLISQASINVSGVNYSDRFLVSEWDDVFDAWQLRDWESYKNVARLGRKTRLPEKQRKELWGILSGVQAVMVSSGQITFSQMFTELATVMKERVSTPFDFVVVDEAQDVSVAQLKFLAALGGSRNNGLFLAGDLGQRIFQIPFSWKSLGVDVRGRCRNLRVNYRTSHQIRSHADKLLAPEVSDIDGNTEERRGTVSVFNGPDPKINIFRSPEDESNAVGLWLKERVEEGVKPSEMGIFVRSQTELNRAKLAVENAYLQFKVLDDRLDATTGHVSICTMHLAKGLEFRAVVVMACDDEVIPLQDRIDAISDDADLEEVYNTERHLLYVACTRARDFLMVSSASPASEFLDDLKLECI